MSGPPARVAFLRLREWLEPHDRDLVLGMCELYNRWARIRREVGPEIVQAALEQARAEQALLARTGSRGH